MNSSVAPFALFATSATSAAGSIAWSTIAVRGALRGFCGLFGAFTSAPGDRRDDRHFVALGEHPVALGVPFVDRDERLLRQTRRSGKRADAVHHAVHRLARRKLERER